MVPELRTPGATSAAKPPLVAVMVPMLTIEASGRPGMLEVEAPGHEVFVADVAGRREEARRVDDRAGAEDDAVAVDDEHLAVGIEAAEDLARPHPADDAVERDRIRIRLDERRLLADADVEHVPVDDGLVAVLIDRDVGGARIVDLRRAADHDAALRPGERGRDRHQRRRDEQEIAEASHHGLRQYFAPRITNARNSSRRGPSTGLAIERSAL